MNRNQVGANHIARQNGQILPQNGKRILRDGTEITGTRFALGRREATVEGVTRNGGTFSITVPMALAGL